MRRLGFGVSSATKGTAAPDGQAKRGRLLEPLCFLPKIVRDKEPEARKANLMIKFLIDNWQWLFDGIGVVGLVAACKLMRRLFLKIRRQITARRNEAWMIGPVVAFIAPEFEDTQTRAGINT